MLTAVLQAVASASSGAGFGLITDIQSGYFDKLLLTPANRGAVVLGRMLADCVRAMSLTVVIIVVALLFGSRMDTGLPGAIVLVLMAGLFGLAYSGLNASLALRTGSPQAAQVGFLLFFPAALPFPGVRAQEVFAPWLEFLATINPVTYSRA